MYSAGLRVSKIVSLQPVHIERNRMMGHVSLSTTTGYMHVSNKFLSSIKSPLDILAEEQIKAKHPGKIK